MAKQTGIAIGLGAYKVAQAAGAFTPKSTNTNGQPAISYSGPHGYNALRGLICAEDDLSKSLVFQFNPDLITESKSSIYADRTYTGLPYKGNLWSNGGDRNISFQLFMDATASSNTPQFGKNVQYGNASVDDLATSQPRGTLDRVELLMSFLYPRLKADTASQSLPVPLFSSGGIVPDKQFLPPPIAIFCYGGYYLRGVITDVTSNHELFNRDLYPVRTRSDVSFTVFEQIAVNIDSNVKLKTVGNLKQSINQGLALSGL